MPWCDDCSKFWNPPELAGGSRCPSCGELLATGSGRAGADPGRVATEAGPPATSTATSEVGGVARAKGAPWHFKLLVVGVTGYMIYRVIWFIEWLPKHV